MKKGFSVIEIMLASGLFMIFATGMVTVVLWGLDNNRLAGEQTIANQYAAEGLEAVRSIRNQAYANLDNSTGTGIILNFSNVWAFSGANNTFDKYTRVIAVADVFRDANNNIVASGGTLDSDTKKVVSTVSWNLNSSRANSVVLTTYLTNWKATGGGGPPTTCNAYCISLTTYIGGTCRKGVSQCNENGETNENGGNPLCIIQSEGGICCCKP